MNESQLQIILPFLKKELTKPVETYTLNNLYLLILLKKKQADIVNKKFLKSCIGSSELFSEDNLKAFCNVLVSYKIKIALQILMYFFLDNYWNY